MALPAANGAKNLLARRKRVLEFQGTFSKFIEVMEAKRERARPGCRFPCPRGKPGCRGTFKCSRRHWGQDAGREGASRHARGGRAPQSVLPKTGLTERISRFPLFRHWMLDVGRSMFDVRCSMFGFPRNPVGVGKK